MNDLISKGDVDPFFALTQESSEWNACIGNQGYPENYVDGYMEAALALVNAVIDHKQYGKRDTLAMPILYNARHALELSLKYMQDILLKERIIQTPHSQNHDIYSHWKLLESTKIGDTELTQYIQNLEIYVVSLSGVDDDGQELRYATNRSGQKSLQDKSLCNLVTIRESLLKMQKILSDAKCRLESFGYERQTKTYTLDLSRKDLEEISKILPPFHKWKENIFDKKKQEIKSAYGIGSNKFSDVINLIKNHRTMASRLGLEFDLLHLTDKKIKAVIQEWRKLHPPRNESGLGTDYFQRDFSAMKKNIRNSSKVQKRVLKLLSADEIADMEAVFYIGRETMFCEFYEKKLASVKKEHKANNNLAQEVGHLMEKTNFLDCIAEGLKILGKPALSRQLITKHGSNRRLFSKAWLRTSSQIILLAFAGKSST